MNRLSLLIIATILSSLVSGRAQAQNWPRFRGDNGSGISDLQGIPSTWSEKDYAWKIELPHVGHSSPIVWEKALFVTSATEGGSERFLHCMDADSGKERWQVSIKVHESQKHQKNSWASSTPVTDGSRVCVLLADDARLMAISWDFSGKEIS